MKNFLSAVVITMAILCVSCSSNASGSINEILSKKVYAKVIASYDNVDDEFEDGVCIVTLNEKYGAIDTNGKEIIPCSYDLLRYCGEGVFGYKEGGYYTGKCGFVAKSGEVIVPAKYDDIGYFNDGLSRVYIDRNYGFVNSKGEEVIAVQYQKAGEFSEGLAYVYDKAKDKYGYINTKNEFTIEPIYDDAGSFSDGLALVMRGQRQFAINPKGEYIVTLKSNEEFLDDEYSCGLVPIIRENNNKYSVVYYNTKAELAFEQEFIYGQGFEDGKALVLQNNKVVYIDTKGIVLEEVPDAELIEDFLDECEYFVPNSVFKTLMKGLKALSDSFDEDEDDEW